MSRSVCIAIFFLVLCGCRFNEINYQGFVEADPHFISVPVNGELIHLAVKKGVYVKNTSKLFQLNDPYFEAQIAAQRAVASELKARLKDSETGARATVLLGLQYQLEQAESSYHLAVSRLERAKQLKNKGAIDLDSYDARVSDVSRLKAARDQVLANIADAKLGGRSEQVIANRKALDAAVNTLKGMEARYQGMYVDAPMDGFVLDTYFAEHEWVPALKPVVSIVNPKEYYVSFYLPVARLTEVHLGDALKVLVEGYKETTQVIVDSIATEATYTPPLVYADNNTSTFVYKIKAHFNTDKVSQYHLGQPVKVLWN